MGDCISKKDAKSTIEHQSGQTTSTLSEDHYTTQIQIGSEKLYQVKEDQMKSKLHKNIVAIIWRSNFSMVGRGTGILISKNLVLTCAHNLYNKGERVENKYLQIYPKQYGMLSDKYEVEVSFTPTKYQQKPIPGNTTYDYALLKLKDLINQRDFVALRSGFNLLPNEVQRFAIFGYPDTKYQSAGRSSAMQAVSQWGLIKQKDGIVQIRDRKKQIIHCISTLPGQSGSPIFNIEGQGEPQISEISVIGIHTGGITTKVANKPENLNVGVLLTDEVIQQLQLQARSMKAEPFRLYKHSSIIQRSTAKQWFDEGVQIGKDTMMEATTRIRQQIRCFESAIEMEKNFVMAYCHKAMAHSELKEFAQAITCYQKAVEINPSEHQIYLKMGDAQKAFNNNSKALQSYQKSLSIKQSQKTYLSIGKVYKDQKKWPLAKEYFDKAIKLNPSHSDAYKELGLLLLESRKISQAIQMFRKSIDQDDKNEQSYIDLAYALEEAGKNTQAIQNYRKATKINPKKAISFISLGLALIVEKNFNEAIQNYQKAIKIDPQNYEAYKELANALKQSEKNQEAIKYYQQALKRNKSEYLPFYNLAKLQAQSNIDSAIQNYEQSLKINPYYFDTHFDLGKLYLGLNNKSEATKCFETCKKINPNHSQTEELLKKCRICG